MRVRVGCLVIMLAACQRTPPNATAAPGVEAAFEVDARGARAIVDRSWTLSGRGQGIGVLIGAVRCDDTLLLSDVTRTLVGKIDISSPLFKSDGTSVEVMDAAASVRWSASNSIVRMAVPFGGNVVATVHSLTKLPDNYVFAQSAEFDWWMNLHSLDGRRLVSDIALPGMPIGWDGDGLYAVDYGQAGRNSTPDSLKILRVRVQAGAAGFSR